MEKDENIIETERLILRRIRMEDAEEVFKNWTSDDDVSRYMTWETHKSVEDTKNWISFVNQNCNYSTSFEWVVLVKETGELIGSIGAYFKEEKDNRFEVGYGYSKKYWRKGYATESLKGVMDYLINEKKIKRFYCAHAKDNPASGAVMQKVGFKYVKDGYLDLPQKATKFEIKEYYLDIE